MVEPDDVLTRPAPPPDGVLVLGDAPELVADLWLPPGDWGRLVIVVHGGFWKAAWDRTHLRPMAAALARAGYVVAVPEYRRVGMPGGGWPAMTRDVARAIANIPIAIAGDHHRDPGAPVVVGHSAGGHLALWAGLRTQAPVVGIVALAGVLDLPEAARLGLGGDATQALLGGTPDQVPEAYADADPAGPRVDLPVALLHGLDDDTVPVAQSRAFAARRPGTGLRELAGTGHYDLIDPQSRAWPAVLGAVADLTSRGPHPIAGADPPVLRATRRSAAACRTDNGRFCGETPGMATLAATLGRSKFVQLTTFRRDGTPVPTPVWVVPDGADLLVVTNATTGKVKRLRHTDRVLLVPCGMRGKVADGAVEVEARGAVIEDPAEVRRLLGLVKRKYPLLGRVLAFRLSKQAETGESVGIRLSAPA